jgi:hypothetical protein
MKFDKMVEFIAESVVPVGDAAFAAEARPANPEFQKWKQENPGKPTYLFYKAQRAKRAGNATPASLVATPAPMGGSYKELPDTRRTKEAVASFVQHNPDAGFEEVLDAITSQSTEETPLNLDPEVVKSAIADVKAGPVAGEEEPDIENLKKTDLAAKYDRMRQALLKARGLKASPGRRPQSRDVVPDLGDEDELGSMSRKINMRDEPIDPNEL